MQRVDEGSDYRRKRRSLSDTRTGKCESITRVTCVAGGIYRAPLLHSMDAFVKFSLNLGPRFLSYSSPGVREGTSRKETWDRGWFGVCFKSLLRLYSSEKNGNESKGTHPLWSLQHHRLFNVILFSFFIFRFKFYWRICMSYLFVCFLLFEKNYWFEIPCDVVKELGNFLSTELYISVLFGSTPLRSLRRSLIWVCSPLLLTQYQAELCFYLKALL